MNVCEIRSAVGENSMNTNMTVCLPGSVAEAKLLEAVQSKATAMVHGLKYRNSGGGKGAIRLDDARLKKRTRGLDQGFQDPQRPHQD